MPFVFVSPEEARERAEQTGVPIQESDIEFIARHGARQINVGGQLLMPDGAVLIQSDGGYSIRHEPSANLQERLRQQRRYADERRKRADVEFMQARTAFSEQASLAARYSNLPGPPPNAPDVLTRLKQRVQKWRDRVLELEKQLSDTPEMRQQHEREQHLARQRGKVAALGQQINAIDLD